MSAPLISIITVTKNCGATLEKTLRSVQAVKDEDIEYIVIDGVSTDDTLAVIGRHEGLVDQFVSEPDTGIYNAMNKGVARAKGAYILFINGDDELIPEGFPAVTEALRASGVDVLCANTCVDSVAPRAEILKAEPWHLLFYNSIPHPSAFVASALLKKYRFREDLRIASDYDLFLHLYLDRHNFTKLDVATALHQRGGVSGNSQLSAAEVERVKRERLRLLYPVVVAVQGIHRLRKRISKAVLRG